MERIPRSFSLVGAGRMGTAIGLCLVRAGFEPDTVWSRSEKSIRRALGLFGKGRKARDLDEAAGNPQMVILGVPDDAIRGTAVHASSRGCIKPNSLWLHLSGFHGLGPLEPVGEKGGIPMGVHPLQTVPDPASGPERLKGVKFSVVCHDRHWAIARSIVQSVGGIPIRTREEQRPLYHAAAVIACNEFVALFNLAAKVMEKATGGEVRSRDLIPLVRATLDGIEKLGPVGALTGPIARGDANVIKGHIDAMEKGAPWALDVYKVLARETVNVAREKGAGDLNAVTDMLG